jgi:hypothetical protein
MESLLVLAAFTFNLCTPAAQPLVNELDFRSPTSCVASEITRINPQSKEEKIKFISNHGAHSHKPAFSPRLQSLAAKYSPSIDLNKVSWINSSFTEEYDPSLSVKVRKAESSGYEALLQVSIPL